MVRRRQQRALERALVVQGTLAVASSLNAGVVPESLFVGWGGLADREVAEIAERVYAVGVPVHTLAPGVLEKVSDTVTPQPVLAVVHHVDVDLDAISAGDGLVVVCVQVRDPGNAGTILRSAAGSGATGVVFCDGSVDPYNPKAVRASAGALFHVPVCLGGPASDVLDVLRGRGFRLVGAAAHGGTEYSRCDLAGRVALTVGNEAWGIEPAVERMLDETITIPLVEGTESLNVSMAAAVLSFEAARQRRSAAVSA